MNLRATNGNGKEVGGVAIGTAVGRTDAQSGASAGSLGGQGGVARSVSIMGSGTSSGVGVAPAGVSRDGCGARFTIS